MGTTPKKPLKFLPPNVLFGNNYPEDQKVYFRVVNETEKIMAYRIRITLPVFYRMPNADGFLEPGQHKDLEILLKKNFMWDASQIPKHKMMAMALNVFDADYAAKKPISEIFSEGMVPVKTEIPLTLHPPCGTVGTFSA